MRIKDKYKLKGYTFREATRPIYGHIMPSDRVRGKARSPWNCAGVKCLLRTHIDMEDAEIWRTKAYVVWHSKRLIERCNIAPKTTLQIERYDLSNGREFPDGFKFKLLPVPKKEHLSTTKRNRHKYKNGVGGPRKKLGRKARRIIGADVRNWGGTIHLDTEEQ